MQEQKYKIDTLQFCSWGIYDILAHCLSSYGAYKIYDNLLDFLTSSPYPI